MVWIDHEDRRWEGEEVDAKGAKETTELGLNGEERQLCWDQPQRALDARKRGLKSMPAVTDALSTGVCAQHQSSRGGWLRGGTGCNNLAYRVWMVLCRR